MTFIDVCDGDEEKKKESFINQVEAETLLDYYVNFIQLLISLIKFLL